MYVEPANNDIVPKMRSHYGNMIYIEALKKRGEKYARADSDQKESLKRELVRNVLHEVRNQKPAGRFLIEVKRGRYEVITDDQKILHIIKADFDKERQNYGHIPTRRPPSRRQRINSIDSDSSHEQEEEILEEEEVISLIKAMILKPVTVANNVQNKDPKERVMLAAQKELTAAEKPSKERRHALRKIIKGLAEGDKFITNVVENEMKISLDPRAHQRWESVKALDNTVTVISGDK